MEPSRYCFTAGLITGCLLGIVFIYASRALA